MYTTVTLQTCMLAQGITADSHLVVILGRWYQIRCCATLSCIFTLYATQSWAKSETARLSKRFTKREALR